MLQRRPDTDDFGFGHGVNQSRETVTRLAANAGTKLWLRRYAVVMLQLAEVLPAVHTRL
jgi:hypothetical protein